MPITIMRFIGLDLGETNSKICFTFPSQGKISEPRLITYNSTPSLPSLLLFNPQGELLGSGSAAYERPEALQFGYKCGFKNALGHDPSAETGIQWLASILLKDLCKQVGIVNLPAESHMTALGASIEMENPKLATLINAVAKVGFPNIEPIPEPKAAVLYHLFKEELPFEKSLQRWLVVDLGASSTRVSLISKETNNNDLQTQLIFTNTDFSGNQLDRLLVNWFHQKYLSESTDLQPKQESVLLQQIRTFKEEFSNSVNFNQDKCKRTLKIDSQSFDVTLSQNEFSGDQIAAPFISQFIALISDPRITDAVNFSEINKILFIGGGSNWYFVKKAAEATFAEKALIPSTPELSVVKGLAVARSGYQPTIKPSSSTAEITQGENVTPNPLPPSPPLPPSFSLTDLNTIRKAALKMIGWFTLAGAVIALILAIINIPCLASLPLTVLEVWMFIKLSGMYGFKLADSEFLWLMVGLVVMSLVLSFIVEAVLTWFPIVGWVLKSAIAAAVVFGLGWAAITYLHRQRLLKMQKRT